MSKYSEIISKSRQSFASGKTKDIEYRKQQLKALYRFLEENESLIVSALNEDLRKPSFETRMAEIDFVQNDIRGALYNIDDYCKPKPVPKSLVVIVHSLRTLWSGVNHWRLELSDSGHAQSTGWRHCCWYSLLVSIDFVF